MMVGWWCCSVVSASPIQHCPPEHIYPFGDQPMLTNCKTPGAPRYEHVHRQGCLQYYYRHFVRKPERSARAASLRSAMCPSSAILRSSVASSLVQTRQQLAIRNCWCRVATSHLIGSRKVVRKEVNALAWQEERQRYEKRRIRGVLSWALVCRPSYTWSILLMPATNTKKSVMTYHVSHR